MADLVPLQDLLTFTRDGEWGKGEAAHDLVKMAVIRGTDFSAVRRGDFSSVPVRYIPKKAVDRKMLRPGDILIETAGGTKDQPTGRTVYLNQRVFDGLAMPVTCASFARFLRVNTELADPHYLFWYLQSIYATGEMSPYHIQHTGVARFQYTDFAAQWRVPVPDKDRQLAIAALLGSLDDKIELNRRMNETLEAMAQAIFRDWFVDFGPTRRKIDGATDPVEIMGGLVSDAERARELADLFPARLGDDGLPEGWTVQPLLDQALWVNGAAYKNMHFSEEYDALPVVKIAELKNGVTEGTKRTNSDLGDRYRICDGELLFSWSGNPDTSIDTFIWTGGDAWLNQHIFAVRNNGSQSRASLYVMLRWLKSDFAEIARNKQTTGLGHVTKDDMKRLMVCVPPDSVKSAFEAVSGPMIDLLIGRLFENRILAANRDLLLPKLMSGEIRLRDAERELEAVA
jgi:type I restriction enzyme S subunit